MTSFPAQIQGQINHTELVSNSLPTQRVAEFAQTRIKLKREMNPIVKVENDIILENTVELTKHLVFCKIKEYENQMNAIKAKIEFEFINKLNSDNFLKKSVEKEIVVTVDTEALQKCKDALAAANKNIDALTNALKTKEIQTTEYKKQSTEYKKQLKKLKDENYKLNDSEEDSEEDESANPNLYFTLA